MTNQQNQASTLSGLEGRDCVPFFESDKSQIQFEFWYLTITFLISVLTLFIIQAKIFDFEINHADKTSIFSIIGGFLGGWVYDTKWFYRVTARGKNDQHGFPWQPHKFYWRIFTPFLSAVVAFVAILLAKSDFFPIAIKNKESAQSAFAICFFFGYFSDLVLSRLAAWAEKIIPKTPKQ